MSGKWRGWRFHSSHTGELLLSKEGLCRKGAKELVPIEKGVHILLLAPRTVSSQDQWDRAPPRFSGESCLLPPCGPGKSEHQRSQKPSRGLQSPNIPASWKIIPALSCAQMRTNCFIYSTYTQGWSSGSGWLSTRRHFFLKHTNTPHMATEPRCMCMGSGDQHLCFLICSVTLGLPCLCL